MKHKPNLKTYVGSRKKVNLERPYPGEPCLDGFLHEMSETLLLVQPLQDFFFNGYIIIPVADVSAVRSDEQDRFFETMLEGEGMMDQVRYVSSVPLTNWNAVLTHFIEKGQYISIECESREDSEDDELYVGKPISFYSDGVWFREFDAMGRWDEEDTFIQLARITRVEFDTPYINIYSKYVEPLE